MRLQVVTFAQGLCSYLEFIQREYSSYSFSRAPKQVWFVRCNNILLMVTCMLLHIRRLNLLNNLAISYLQSVSFIVRSPSANYACQSCYLLVFLSTKSFSLRVRTYIGSRVYKSRSPLRMQGMLQQFCYHRDNKTVAIRGKDEFPLGKVKVLSVVYCFSYLCHLSQFPNAHPLYQVRTVAMLSNIVSILATCSQVSLL